MKLLMQKLARIKEICEKHTDCANCVFGTKEYGCEVKEIVYALCRRPCDWDLKEVEKWQIRR